MMDHSTFKRCGGKPVPSFTRLAAAALLVAWSVHVSHAADDLYLELLDEEVTKVEAVPTDKEEEGASHRAENGGGDVRQEMVSFEQFETLLRNQHVGTYSFYRRLPERSREEVFLDYSRGVSMESLREKVIDRFLHP